MEGNNSDNSRNGYNHKTITSDYGESKIAIPCDRNGEFQPQIMEKRQVRTDEIERKNLAMYAKGMSQRDIEDNLHEIYGAQVSQTLISKITDKNFPEVNEWQNRPLEVIYPILYFDGIVFKSRKDSKLSINVSIRSLGSTWRDKRISWESISLKMKAQAFMLRSAPTLKSVV